MTVLSGPPNPEGGDWPNAPSVNRLEKEYMGTAWNIKNHPLQPPENPKPKRKYFRNTFSDLPGRPHWVKEANQWRRISNRDYQLLVEDAWDQYWDCQYWFVGQVNIHAADPNRNFIVERASSLGYTIVDVPKPEPTYQDRLLQLLYTDQPLTLHQIAITLRPDVPLKLAKNQASVALHHLFRTNRVTQSQITRAYSISAEGISSLAHRTKDDGMITFRIEGDVVVPSYMNEDESTGGEAINRLRLVTEKYGCMMESQFTVGDFPAPRKVTGRKVGFQTRYREVEATQYQARWLIAVARDLGEPPLTFETWLERLYFPLIQAEDKDQYEDTPMMARAGLPAATPEQLLAVRDKARRMRLTLQRLGKINCVRDNDCNTWLLFEHDDPRLGDYFPGKGTD